MGIARDNLEDIACWQYKQDERFMHGTTSEELSALLGLLYVHI